MYHDKTNAILGIPIKIFPASAQKVSLHGGLTYPNGSKYPGVFPFPFFTLGEAMRRSCMFEGGHPCFHFRFPFLSISSPSFSIRKRPLHRLLIHLSPPKRTGQNRISAQRTNHKSIRSIPASRSSEPNRTPQAVEGRMEKRRGYNLGKD